MRCKRCKAWEDGKCIAGITPYQSKKEIDGIGCACNTRTVEKLIRKNKKTIADRIRAMADEELAKTFADYISCHNCPIPYCEVRFTMERLECQANWLDWLRQEVEPCTK